MCWPKCFFFFHSNEFICSFLLLKFSFNCSFSERILSNLNNVGSLSYPRQGTATKITKQNKLFEFNEYDEIPPGLHNSRIYLNNHGVSEEPETSPNPDHAVDPLFIFHHFSLVIHYICIYIRRRKTNVSSIEKRKMRQLLYYFDVCVYIESE